MLNLHIYPSHITNESRMLKEAKTIVSHELVKEVVIAGFWKNGLLQKEHVDEGIDIIRLNCYFDKLDKYKFLNGFPFLIFYFKCFVLSIKAKARIVNAHSLTVLPLAFFIKLFTGARLVYDAHELETETHESTGTRKKIARFLERLFIKAADHVIVVSDSIRDWYVKEYQPDRISVIKNIPSGNQDEVLPKNLKELLNVPEDNILFIYQGFLSVSRGVGDIIEVFLDADPSKHVVFMGFGPLKAQIINTAAARSNIHFLPAVKPHEILSYTMGADVGIHIIPNTCLNHYYCLPNKVFEYLLAEIPFIVSDFPDIRKEFEPVDVAWFVNPGKTDLQQVVDSITTEKFRAKKKNCSASRGQFKWENQEAIFREIYRQLAR